MAEFLGIAVLPRHDFMEKAIAIQAELATDTSLDPRLSTQHNLPHVTLFQGPLQPNINFSKTLIDIRESSGVTSDVHTEAVDIAYQPKGWIFLNVKKVQAFSRLQSATVKLIESHLDSSAIDRGKDISAYTPTERESYQRYGYRYVGVAFAPHVTLGRTDEQLARQLADRGQRDKLGAGNWIFDRLSFYVMGELGAHAEQLAEHPLGVRLDKTQGAMASKSDRRSSLGG